MSKLKTSVQRVVENQPDYPSCVVSIAREMYDCFQKRREGVLTLRSGLNSAWKFWLNTLHMKKKLGESYKDRRWSASRMLWAYIGNEQNEKFHKAKTGKNNGRSIVNYYRLEFEACLLLLKEEKNDRVYEWMRCVNAEEVNTTLEDVAYLRNIRHKYLAEILAWKAMRIN